MFFLTKLRNYWEYFAVSIVFAGTAIYITFPLIFHLGDLATNLRDELLISWIQVSVLRNLLHNPFDLFRGNIFYPYNNTLAYSYIHVVSAVLSAFPLWLTGQPITTLNATLILSLFLLGLAAFIVTFSITKSFFPGIISGFLLQFSPTVLDKNVHVQILAIEWVVFGVLSYDKWLRTKKLRYFILALFFFVIQTWNSFVPGYFTLLSYSIFTLVYCLKKKRRLNYYFAKKHIAFLITAFLLLVPVALPYLKVANEFSFKRDIREVVHLSLQPEDLYYPNDLTRLQPFLDEIPHTSIYPGNAELKVGYLGFAFSILCVMTIWYCIKKKRSISPQLLSFVLIALCGLLLSFGPALHFGRRTVHAPFIVPLPYALLYYIVPGFQGIRAAYHWEMLFVLFMAVSCSIVLVEITSKLNHVKKIGLYALIIISIIIEYKPMHFMKVPQVKSFPPVYRFLKERDQNAIIAEMPIYNWNMAPYSSQELMRVYYSSVHHLRMLNGASGFSPPPWQKLVTVLLITFPSKDSVQQMKELGITYIILHTSEYNLLRRENFNVSGTKMPNGKTILIQLDKNTDVKEVKRFGDDYIFAIK